MKKYNPKVKNPDSPRAMLMVKRSETMSGYEFDNPPSTWEQDCDKIMLEGKVTLSQQSRTKLWQAIFSYMSQASYNSSVPAPKDIKKTIKNIHSATAKLLSLLNRSIETEEPSASWPLIREYSELSHTINDLPIALRDLENSCKTIIENFDKHVKGGSGRESHTGFNKFIEGLAMIYEKEGGNVAANYSSNYNEDYGGRNNPFVRFCWYSFQMAKLPPNVSKPNRSTFGSAVYNYTKGRPPK